MNSRFSSPSTGSVPSRHAPDALAPLPSAPSGGANPTRYFYAGAASLLLLLVFLGFQRFYLHGQTARGSELFGPLRILLIVHGVAMTGWVVLFLTQSLLIAGRNRRLHLKLGLLGAVLAASIVVLGPYTAIQTARLMPDIVRSGLSSRPFLAIQFGAMLNFGALVAIGLAQRRRAEIHRPMMFLATLSILGAATARIDWLRDLYRQTIWDRLFGPYFIFLLVGALILAVKTALARAFDRWLAAGLAILTVNCALILAIAHTDPWARLMKALVP